MKNTFILFTILFYFFSCGNTGTTNKTSGETASRKTDTCESPDADIGCCFLNMPSGIGTVMNIAGESEPGQRIKIIGQILKAEDNTPYSGVIIYAYHTDNKGYYSKKGNETGFQKYHGYLHGWCVTDSEGKYEIHTVKPVRYPSNNAPAHIHCAVKEPSGRMTYINDFVFSDDSLVNKEYLSYMREPGDQGIITLKDDGSGIQTGSRVTPIKSE